MKVAIVCDYLNVYGGGERTLEAILEIYPEATVYTSLYDPSKFRNDSPIGRAKVVSFFDSQGLCFERPGGVEKFFQRLVLDCARTLKLPISLFPKHFTFIFPYFFERIDLSGFDVVISIGTIWAKGVKTTKDQTHVFYCLTPPRFLYKYPSETSKRNVWYYRPFTVLLDHWLRIWDFNAAQKPNEILVISDEVGRRVKKFYRRDSLVIYPPVEVFHPEGVNRRRAHPQGGAPEEKYFLIVSRLASYKGIDVAIRACNELKLSLKIVGTGREQEKLKALAGPTIEFLGFKSDEEIDNIYLGARALIFPTPDEDFGIVPLEANAHGVPVIAHKSGGPLETLVEGKTGVYFNNIQELEAILVNFDPSKFNYQDCVANARRFSQEAFKMELRQFIETNLPAS